MKRTRSGKIRDVIVTKENLSQLYSLLERKFAEDVEVAREKPKYDQPAPPTITVKSQGGMTTEANDRSILENDVIDLQKSMSIEFSYTNYRAPKAKRISIDLEETDEREYGRSAYSMSGEDPGWVDATYAELQRIVSSMRPQSTLLYRYRWVAIVFFGLVIGEAWVSLVELIPSSQNASTAPKWIADHPILARQGLRAVLGILPGISAAWWLVHWLVKLWPVVEFDFGPEHLKRRKNVRGRVAVVISVIVLPFAMEAFKKYLLGW